MKKAIAMIWTALLLIAVPVLAQSPNVNPPASPVKLIFIHHSTGENWLADENGGLGIALMNNNYFVSDTYYGWNGEVGDNTDIGHWWTWFRSLESPAITSALYAESEQATWFTRLTTDPGGENEIIMFKSCFPNSNLTGDPTAAPSTGDNPLRGQDAWSAHMLVGHAKGIYADLLTYFRTRPDRLFIAITAPPLGDFDTDAATASNARAFNDWLVNDWLTGYDVGNVAVFDFYNVLTSNGGSATVNDAGAGAGNHHRVWNGEIQHIQTVANDMSAYPSDTWDSHPSMAGNLKAAEEFPPLLNSYYNAWREAVGDGPAVTGSAPDAPVLSIDVDGLLVTFSWTPVADADSYMFYYVSFPDGDIAGSFEFSSTGMSVPLWSGIGLCCAVRARNAYGMSEFSNIEAFVIP